VLGSVVKARGLGARKLVDMTGQVGFETAADTGEGKTRTFSLDFVRNELVVPALPAERNEA
jgi:hypothetical protein